MKKILLLIFLGLIVTSCKASQFHNEDFVENAEIQDVVEEKTEESEIDPVSLLAMMQKEYNGRDLKLGNVLSQNAKYTRYFITYKSDELTISGIMNIPKGTGPFPVAVLNHGYIDPAVYTNGRGLKREQDYLASRGYVVIHSDYRNHAQSGKEESTEYSLRLGYTTDVINAIVAVKNSDFDFIDKNNFVMLGHSMGGGVAQNIMVVRPGLVQAFVLFAPVSADYRDNFEKWTKSRTEVYENILKKYGSFETSKLFWNNVSPINFIENITEPIMIHHGIVDESVPLEWSQRFADRLKESERDVVLHIYENEPHEFINAWPQVMKRTIDFFDENVKK